MGALRFDGRPQEELVLDELNLREDVLIEGPPGRKMRFNSALESDPIPANHNIAEAQADSVDWDNDGQITSGPLAPPHDLTRIVSSPVAYQEDLRAYTDGAVGAGCSRCDATTIETYLSGLGLTLDVDDDGMAMALTDGLLLLRFLFGFTGSTLITGAVGAGCMTCDAAGIAGNIQGLI